MKGSIVKWLRAVYLFPFMLIMSVPGEGSTEIETTAETVDDELERPEHISEEEWSDLSQEEREGLLMEDIELGDDPDAELSEEELSEEELEAIAGESDDGEAASENDIALTEEEEPSRKETPVTQGDIPSDAELLAYRPTVPDAELPLSDEVPTALQAKMDDLDVKFENAEISQRDYNREMQAINRQVMAHNIQVRDAVREDRVWEKEQTMFFRGRPEYAEKSLKGDALFGALGKAVETLNADPKNATKSGMQILLDADKAVREAFGLPLHGEQSKPKSVAPAPASKPAQQNKPVQQRPDSHTLAHVPNAGSERTSDPFSALDRLTGEAFENALSKLTPEQRDRYLSRA